MNIGDRLRKIILGPRLAYCPRERSRKKRGRPATSSMMVYGIRKMAAEVVCINIILLRNFPSLYRSRL